MPMLARKKTNINRRNEKVANKSVLEYRDGKIFDYSYRPLSNWLLTLLANFDLVIGIKFCFKN
jgi:hypothetical protein